MSSSQQRNNPTLTALWVAFTLVDSVALMFSVATPKVTMATYCLTIVVATDLITAIVIWGIRNCSKMEMLAHLTISRFLTSYGLFVWAWGAYYLQSPFWQLTIIAVIAMVILASIHNCSKMETPAHSAISRFLTNYGLFVWAWAAYRLQPHLWQLTIIAVIAMVIIVSLNAGVVVHVFNYNNPSWLAGNDGRIGLANWLSITRMAASLVVPGIFGFQTFGDRSFLIGTATLICIQATDCLDGLAARKLGQVTKAGKYLDPLGDKAVFYPAAIAMLIGTQGHLGFIAPNTPLWPTVITLTVFIGGLAVGLTRDVLVVVWFKLEGTKLPQGISSSWLEKIRAVSMYVWLDSTALGLCTNGLPSSSFKAISFISLMMFSWILSPTTFFTGLYRVRTLQKELGLR